MSKSKEQRYFLRKLVQKGYLLACILAILFVSFGSAQALVTDTLGAAAVVTNSSLINPSWQLNSSPAAFSALNQSTIPVNITSTGIINSTTDNNALYSAVLANNKTLFTDIALVSGSAADSSLSSVNIQQNSAITAFARTNGTSVTSTLTNPATSSSASLSGNSISADTTLNKASQTAEGNLDLTFNSSHAGSATLQPANLSGDAGIFAGSFQHNNVISSTVMGDPFAQISGTNSIALTATGTLGSSLTLKADNNSISAAFTGNNAENLLAVESGGATALTSSAGIANLQINSNYNYISPGVYGSNTSAIIAAGSSISASVQTNPFTSSSLSFDGNQLQASATGSVSKNELQVASGLNVSADGSQANSLDFTSGSEAATTSGGLFLNNMQLNANAPISATATDPAGAAAALSVYSRGLIQSILTADGNSFEAIALGNDAYGSISVGGSNSFISTVAASNLQESNLSPVTAIANSGTISVRLGTPGTTATDNIIDSTISVDNNTVSALAVANRDPLLVSITGTTVTDGGTTAPVSTSIDNSSKTLTSTAGISAISSQAADGSDVTASNTGAGVNLITTNYPVPTASGSHVSNSTFTQSGNSLTSMANLNEGLVAVGIDASQIDASTAAASIQNTTTANVSATTSGTIITGINARQGYPGDTIVGNSSLSVLVGDGNLSDSVFEGNSISSTAGGNLNATALEAKAANTMLVTDVINHNGATSNSLSLSTNATDTNTTLAEMTVLTDQRLVDNAITATTDVSQIAGVIRTSTYTLSDSTLKVDGNQVTATARGNLTSNSLDFSAQRVDMSTAEAGTPSTAAGSNLASMGAVQIIDADSSVTANINAGAGTPGTNDEILGKIWGVGNLTNVAVSADKNSVVAAATGNNVISSLSGSGGTLVQDAPNNQFAYTLINPLPTAGTAISNTAVANTVVQSNAGTVAANLAIDEDYEITSTITPRNISKTTVTADNNRAVAIATGSSADVSTTLAFNTLESSAATAVQQAQSGSTTATVGGDGGVIITASIANSASGTPANLVNTRISASGNTAGAEATGATATNSLAGGGAHTVTLASGFMDGAPDYATAAIYGSGTTENYVGDYMLGIQQNISGTTAASANNMSIRANGGRFAAGSLAADNNLLTAQATGGTSQGPLDSKGVPTPATLSLQANDMTASGNTNNTVIALLSSDQTLTAGVTADLIFSYVFARAINLNDVATGTNDAESVSVNNNTLLATGIGLKSTNALNTNAATSVLGQSVGLRGASATAANVSGSGWDRLIVSKQDVGAGGAVSVSDEEGIVAAFVTGDNNAAGDINTDSLSVDHNSILAEGTGASSSNTLSTNAGAAITSVSQAIVARQASAGTVTVSNSSPGAILIVMGNSTDSNLSISDNELAATATGLDGAHTLSMRAASITDTGLLPTTAKILSRQDLADTAEVAATITDSLARLNVDADLNGSALKVDNNIQKASAKGATNSNSMSASSGSLGTTGTEGTGFAVVAIQNSAAPVSATNSGAGTYLAIGEAASGDSLGLSGNSISASASNLTAENSLTAKALTANIGDTSTLTYLTATTASADRSILSIQDIVDTGEVSATVQTDPTMSLSVVDGLSGNSTAYLGSRPDPDHIGEKLPGNIISSTATVASNSNTLTNNSGTLLSSSTLIGSVQSSAADSTAVTDLTDSGGLFIDIGTSTSDATLALAGNQVTASATGLTTANTLNVKAGSMQGAIPPALGSITASLSGGNPLHNIQDGFSSISSEQTTSGAISAMVDTPNLGIDLAGGVTNSAVHADSNLVQASSTAASATNNLMQLADSMAQTPALLAASQVISGSSAATVASAWIWSHVDGDVSASSTTADNNTIQAVATGGAMKNYIDPGSGTSITAQIKEPDPAVTTTSSSFTGSYGIASRQTSTAPVTATVDAEPQVELAVGNIDNNSSVSASGNIIRAQANNLTTDNSVVTAAATALSGVTSGVLSYQNVAAATSGPTTGAQVQLTGFDLTGAANADSNWLVAITTGGSATNALSLSGMSVSGAPVGALSSLATSISAGPALSATSGSESLASLLNVQSRTAAVTATLADGTPANADGNLSISAGFDAVNGSVSVSKNMMAAEARGLVADNSVTLTSKTMIDGGSTTLGNVQSSTAPVIATINNGTTPVTDDARIILTATGSLTGTATLNGNTALSAATSNLAINSLTASAGTEIEMLNLGNSTTTTITIPVLSATASTVGFALQNLQSGTAAVTSSITNFDIQGTLNSLNGAATVDNNTVLSQSQGQASQNSMILNAGTTLNTSASLANGQMNSGAISSAITNGNIGLTATGVTGTTSVSGNRVQASSTANLALNSMDISGTLAASTGGSVGSLTATADYVALNTQSNSANVNSSVSNYTIGFSHSTSTSSTASVLNNAILADATGNSSTNTFTLSPKASSNTADFAFTGYQSNTGAISSSISGASISLASTGIGGSTGTFNATGNRIGATAIGNSSISSIKSGR